MTEIAATAAAAAAAAAAGGGAMPTPTPDVAGGIADLLESVPLVRGVRMATALATGVGASDSSHP